MYTKRKRAGAPIKRAQDKSNEREEIRRRDVGRRCGNAGVPAETYYRQLCNVLGEKTLTEEELGVLRSRHTANKICRIGKRPSMNKETIKFHSDKKKKRTGRRFHYEFSLVVYATNYIRRVYTDGVHEETRFSTSEHCTLSCRIRGFNKLVW